MNAPETSTPRYRFSIADLLKYVTVCAVLMAISPLTGVPAAVLLTAFALSLVARQGLLAVFLFIGALFASQAIAPDRAVSLGTTIVVGFAVIGGYRLHRRCQDRPNFVPNAASFDTTEPEAQPTSPSSANGSPDWL